METSLTLISPQRAKELLEQNTCNRTLRENHVKNLASDMLNGLWRDKTGESIKFTKSGQLIDGQHRLHAVIRSGKSIRFMICEGLDANVMDVIDTGIKRNASDVLFLKGVKNASVASAIIKSFLSDRLQASQSNIGISNRMIENEYLSDAVFWDNVSEQASKWYRQCRAVSTTLFGYCYACVLRKGKNATKAITFFSGISTGKECAEIIIDLRNKMMNNQLSDKGKFTPHYKINLIRTYWNAYVKGRKTIRDEKSDGWL
jgi:hypothetical protein